MTKDFVNLIPLLLFEFCSQILYHVAGEASTEFAALFQIISVDESCEESGRVHVAGTSGVDNVHFVASDSHFLIAALNHRAFATDFYYCYLAMFRKEFQSFLGCAMCQCFSLFLVSENDVDLRNQPHQKVTVILHNIV